MSKNMFAICFLLLVGCRSALKTNVETKVNDKSESSTSIIIDQDAELLNSLLDASRNNFDFHGKYIAFITGSGGSRFLSKEEFFRDNVDPWLAGGKKPQIFMEVLSESERMETGGCDAFVLVWVKVLTERQRKGLIDELANN